MILKDKAAVFVDGRYTVQVREQVDPKLFEIRDLVDGGVPAYLREAAKLGFASAFAPPGESAGALPVHEVGHIVALVAAIAAEGRHAEARGADQSE